MPQPSPEVAGEDGGLQNYHKKFQEKCRKKIL
jgi:hypothetical protein